MKGTRLLSFVLAAALAFITLESGRSEGQSALTEAPADFDNESNGFTDAATFAADREVFEERELTEDGLGPVYNAQSCAECHQNPVTGGVSQVSELRAGFRRNDGSFVDPPGGSLINDRAIHATLQERVPLTASVRAFRASLATLGDGFVEAIADETLVAIAANQARQSKGKIAGQVVRVAVLEAPGTLRVGRFGWKNQHASLLSFSADAYLNEMGITSPLQPVENTSMGRSVSAFDIVPDPEDDGVDAEAFTRFMRATKVPPRDENLARTDAAQAGARIFDAIGCASCHVSTIATAPPGTPINGAAFIVPDALGNKIIHPYGDFLLHNVGTGDGIVQNGGNSTAVKIRTAPLWGLRAKPRLMHDGLSATVVDAILRHRGEATLASRSFLSLGGTQRNQLLAFLASL